MNLENIIGDIAFLAVIFRSTAQSNTNNGLLQYRPLGDGALFDLVVDNGGKSLYGLGSPLKYQFLRDIVKAQHWKNDFNKDIVFIPFCDNIDESFKGKKSGYRRFNGENIYLSITPGAAPTSGINY